MKHLRIIPCGFGAALTLLVCALLAAGATCTPTLNESDTQGSVLGSSPDSLSTTIEADGSSTSFDAAQSVTVPDGGELEISGQIGSVTDVNLFDLGSVNVGDRVVAEIDGVGEFDPVSALFDADGNLLLLNDDGSFFAGLLGSRLDLVVAADTARCFLAVATSPDNASSGDYTGRVSIARGGAAPIPSAQSVVLDFDGASAVSIGGRTPVDVPAFDAALIDSSYAGQTDGMILAIQSRVNQDFGGLNLLVRTSADAAVDPTVDTVVYFGTFSSTLLGLADNVDTYNSDPSQKAIIYVDTFSLFMPLQPSVDEMAQALANVTSHEIGHLLGLNHTADPSGLMDITGTANQLLVNQRFEQSPLVPELFPVGSQNALSLLLATIGEVSPGAVAAAQIKSLRAVAPARLPGELALPKTLFLSCGCHRCVVGHLKRAMFAP